MNLGFLPNNNSSLYAHSELCHKYYIIHFQIIDTTVESNPAVMYRGTRKSIASMGFITMKNTF